MKDIVLTSIQNPIIKQVRKLHRSKERQRQNLLLLEGKNIIISAVELNYPLVTVFCTLKWQQRHQQFCQTVIERGYEIRLVSPEVLNAIATTVNPDGVVAIAKRQAALTPNIEQIKLGLAIERLQDPGNLGTIIRTAVATGVDSLWLSEDSVDFDHPKVLRASVGEWLRLPMAVTSDLPSVVERYKQQGTRVIATVPQAQKTYWELDLTRPSLLLMGNEAAGLSSETLALADELVSIPLANRVESLNVAIATALILYEARRQSQVLPNFSIAN